MRSLSGGAYRLTPAAAPARMRRQSGDDVLTRVSPSRRAAIFEHFRPRSKSDSKGKRPTFLANLRNSIFSGGPPRREEEPEPLQGFHRQRSGSDSRGGTMSKVMDLFRGRSNSLSGGDNRSKKSLNSTVPPNAFLRRHSLDPSRKRRPFHSHRSLDPHQGDACHSEDDVINQIDFSHLDEDLVIPEFLRKQPCYYILPVSGKVVVLSVELLVKNAFNALVINEIKSAPLWDKETLSFVGLLTISDFIDVLRHYYESSPNDIKDIENQSIATWRKIQKSAKPFIKVNGSDSLSVAAKLLIEEKVHRIPVIDEKRDCILFVLTRKKLLSHIHNFLKKDSTQKNIRKPNYLGKTIKELNIGTYENIAKVTEKTKIIEALDLFANRNVSALPIVDECDKLKDIFEKFDIFALAKDQTYHNLDMTISEAINITGVQGGTYVCKPDQLLGDVINTFVNGKAHRLVIHDENEYVVGMISLSDILRFLVVEPLNKLESQSLSRPSPLISLNESTSASDDVIDETPEGAVGGESSVFLDSETQDSVSASGSSKDSVAASGSSKDSVAASGSSKDSVAASGSSKDSVAASGSSKDSETVESYVLQNLSELRVGECSESPYVAPDLD